jgi:DNA (cytosine-5)-methyltransferase 1
MSDLASASDYGYKVYADRFKFEEYGVPQSRHRMILVGYKGDFFEKNKVNYIKPKKLFESANDFITCKTALEEGVPGTKQSPLSLKKAANQELTKHSKDVLLRLENTKEGQNVWDLEDKFGLPGVTKARMSHIYKKLDSTRPSYTVTGSGGGGTHVYHYKENRALTNRERARLQTFDDSYEFKGSKEEVRKQIGMAVPVLAAKHILKAVYKSLKKNKESVKSHHDWMIDPFGKTLNFTGQAKLNNENQMDFNF